MKSTTFIHMRSLLVLIVCCLQFIAPSRSHATIQSKQLTFSTRQTSGIHLQKASLEHQQFAEMCPASYLNYTNTLVRIQPIIKSYLSALNLVHPYQQKTGIQYVERYKYPKPIGLILIFPQHYYW
jgi:hypothetical protein